MASEQPRMFELEIRDYCVNKWLDMLRSKDKYEDIRIHRDRKCYHINSLLLTAGTVQSIPPGTIRFYPFDESEVGQDNRQSLKEYVSKYGKVMRSVKECIYCQPVYIYQRDMMETRYFANKFNLNPLMLFLNNDMPNCYDDPIVYRSGQEDAARHLENMAKLQSNGYLIDFRLDCGSSRFIDCHWIVVTAMSSCFQRYVVPQGARKDVDFSQRRTGVAYDSAKLMIDLMYGRKVIVTEDKLRELYAAADHFGHDLRAQIQTSALLAQS